jgi:hypothetical protein
MRRWFAVLLLALVPLQFSWAVVVSYCEHETQAAAGHFGHHEHQHHGEDLLVADNDAARDDVTGATQSDCGHCHGTCCSMPTLSGGLTPRATALHAVTPVEGRLRTLAPTPPERPQWARFA